jgi:hypothetical protein
MLLRVSRVSGWSDELATGLESLKRLRGVCRVSCADRGSALKCRMVRKVTTLIISCAVAASLLADGGGCGDGGGSGGFCGFGSDASYPFELPKVEEDVQVAGMTLKLNRTKWGYSVFAPSAEGPLARFDGEDIQVTLRPVAAPPENDRAFAQALASQEGVLYARRIATSGAITGVKAAYGSRGSLFTERTKVRYFLRVAGSNWLCFEARPTGKSPQWQDANDLILGAKPDRSRS